jgi:hypothetical protein
MHSVRIQMTIPADHPGIHDGNGGVHRAGSMPQLPTEIAAAFVQKGFGKYIDSRGRRAWTKIKGRWSVLEYRDKISTIALLLATIVAIGTAIGWLASKL